MINNEDVDIWYLSSLLPGTQHMHIGFAPSEISAIRMQQLKPWVDTRFDIYRLNSRGRCLIAQLSSEHRADVLNERVVEMKMRRVADARSVAEALDQVGLLGEVAAQISAVSPTDIAEGTQSCTLYYYYERNRDHYLPRMLENLDTTVLIKSREKVPGTHSHGVFVYGQALWECEDLCVERGFLRQRFLARDNASRSLFWDDTGRTFRLSSGDTIDGDSGSSYRILDEAGSGGTSRVYRAEIVGSGEMAAAKVLSGDRFPLTNLSRARFEREARTLQRFRNRHLVRYLDRAWAHGELVLLTEFLPGGSLNDQLQSRTAMDVSHIYQVLTHVLRGLVSLHEGGIVHRDVTPKNIYIRDRDYVLGDLGGLLDLRIDDMLTGTGEHIGSLLYISPNQFRSPHAATARDDLYSLGQIGSYMVTGFPPVGTAAPLHEARSDYPEFLLEVIDSLRSPWRSPALDARATLEMLRLGESPTA